MEELFELRSYIEKKDYSNALILLGEMEEMSLDDKSNKIFSFTVILLLHLIKQHAEKRTTRSWDASIFNSLKGISRTNKRRKSGGFYLKEDDFREIIEDAWNSALKEASLEAFGGSYDENQILAMIDKEKIKNEAFQMIIGEHKLKH